jgi:hypothetical protein
VKWLLQLYPAAWRDRYGEEFDAVLERQPASIGMVLDVLAGAVDAHIHPQVQSPQSKSHQGEDVMTFAMLQRCILGGPKLSSQDRQAGRKSMMISSLIMVSLYLVLTKIYRSAVPVQAFGYAIAPFLGLIYEQAAYLRTRPRLTRAVLTIAGLIAMYAFMLAVSWMATKL